MKTHGRRTGAVKTLHLVHIYGKRGLLLMDVRGLRARAGRHKQQRISGMQDICPLRTFVSPEITKINSRRKDVESNCQ